MLRGVAEDGGRRRVSGDTFSRAVEGAPWYRVKHVSDQRYAEGHPYANLHGVWVLTLA